MEQQGRGETPETSVSTCWVTPETNVSTCKRTLEFKEEKQPQTLMNAAFRGDLGEYQRLERKSYVSYLSQLMLSYL